MEGVTKFVIVPMVPCKEDWYYSLADNGRELELDAGLRNDIYEFNRRLCPDIDNIPEDLWQLAGVYGDRNR